MTLHDPLECDACERMREYVRAGQLICIHAIEADGRCELCTLDTEEIASLPSTPTSTEHATGGTQ